MLGTWRCPISPSTWVLGLCGGPDAPHAARDKSLSHTEGSGVGNRYGPSVVSKLCSLPSDEAARLSLHMQMSGSVGCVWEAVLWKQRLYVQVPSDLVPEGSKQGFITMLEFAEEALECTHVIVCFQKDASQRAVFLRTFMFLGFQILAPGHSLVPSLPDSICMAYTIQ